ncbi:MAG: LL-diaminopimelate aminotransferase [Christensenellaceae bacterium]|jgi:LL-diaminopimelate aminotransferase|nr:LL-diaminopimelate aminotransferase [Christensenellaceae bacterium]
MKINTNFEKMPQNYLFAEVGKRTSDYVKANPGKKVLRMGIGDVSGPLAPVVVEAMQKAAAELGQKQGFRGYPPYEGYDFLREAIAAYYATLGVRTDPSEVYVNDGAKSDAGNFGDIFDVDNAVLMPDPVYPVYLDSNLMSGRRILYMNGSEENGFLPLPDPSVRADIIYLCSPNNPTGAVYTREGLKAWVDYANDQGAVILYDAAYEAFISDPALPRSIFSIEGARTCAVEMCSMSKTAGFTGVRCGYTIIPKELSRGGQSIGALWLRRQATKFNGVSYPVQRGAEAAFGKEGYAQCMEAIAFYKENAAIMGKAIGSFTKYFGGSQSPYIWLKCPNGLKSWAYFDYLLNDLQIVGTPGAGFGKMGEGYLRLTAFGEREAVLEAMERIQKAPF